MSQLYSPAAGHINRALGNLVVKHPTRAGFIADQIVNVVPVEKEADKFYKIRDNGVLDMSKRTKKAAGTESNQVDVGWTEDSYICEEHALHDVLPHRTRDNADGQLQLETECVAAVRELVLLAKEIRDAAILFSSTYMTNTTATGARWDDSTPGNIKAWNEILDSKLKVAKFSGADADSFAISAATWTALAKFIMSQGGPTAGVQYAGLRSFLMENPDKIPPNILGMRLIVGSATYSTAEKASNVSRAASGGNMDFVWTDNALVFYRGQPGLKSVQLAARFVKTGQYPVVRQGEYADTRRATWYEYAEVCSDPKVIAASCGFLLTNTLT